MEEGEKLEKQYVICRIVTKERETRRLVADKTYFKHKFVEEGYANRFDTLEEAENRLSKIIEFAEYTIIPIYCRS